MIDARFTSEEFRIRHRLASSSEREELDGCGAEDEGEEDGEYEGGAWPHAWGLRGVRVTGEVTPPRWSAASSVGADSVTSVWTGIRSSAAADRRPRQIESIP
jgi:hypothetical protein